MNMVEQLKGQGVEFEDISVPEHDDGFLILVSTAQLEYPIGVRGNAMPYFGRSYTLPDMITNFSDSMNNQNEYGKMCCIWEEFYKRHFSGLNLLPRTINRMATLRRFAPIFQPKLFNTYYTYHTYYTYNTLYA